MEFGCKIFGNPTDLILRVKYLEMSKFLTLRSNIIYHLHKICIEAANLGIDTKVIFTQVEDKFTIVVTLSANREIVVQDFNFSKSEPNNNEREIMEFCEKLKTWVSEHTNENGLIDFSY